LLKKRLQKVSICLFHLIAVDSINDNVKKKVTSLISLRCL